MKLAALFAACAFLIVPELPAQLRADARNLHERVIVVVPITGSGTHQDPKRPLLAPAAARDARLMAGLVQWSWEPSDDGKLAIAEFVFRGRTSAQVVASDTRVLRSFQKGKAKPADIEKELRKIRKDYRFDKRGPGGAK